MRSMLPKDTSPEAEALVNELYRKMSPAEKLMRVFSAYKMGQELAIAGLKMRYPKADKEELEWLWKRQHLGAALFEEIYGKERASQLPK